MIISNWLRLAIAASLCTLALPLFAAPPSETVEGRDRGRQAWPADSSLAPGYPRAGPQAENTELQFCVIYVDLDFLEF